MGLAIFPLLRLNVEEGGVFGDEVPPQPRLIVGKFDYNFQTASVRVKRSAGCGFCLAAEEKRSPFRALVSPRRHGIIFPFVVSDADTDRESADHRSLPNEQFEGFH